MKRYEISWKDYQDRQCREVYRSKTDAISRLRWLDVPDGEAVSARITTYRFDKAMIYGLLLLVLGIVIAAVGSRMAPINSMDIAVLLAIAGASAYTSIQVVKYL